MNPAAFFSVMLALLLASVAWLVMYPSNTHADTTRDGWHLLVPIYDHDPRPGCKEGELAVQHGHHRLWVCDERGQWWTP